jgi:hypothetical protein
MNFTAVPSHVIFAGPFSANSTEHQPFSTKIHKRLKYISIVNYGVVYLPQWCVMEGSLSVVAISKGGVFESHMPFIYVGSWDPLVP